MPAQTANYVPQFATDGELGANFQTTFAISQADGLDNPPNGVGTKRIATNGSEYIYVYASATMNQGDCVAIDQYGNATQMTTTLATNPLVTPGFCEVVGGIPALSYGWVQIAGALAGINVLTGSAAGAPLYTTATAGVLSSTATSQVEIDGVSLTLANSSGSTALRAAIATALRIVN